MRFSSRPAAQWREGNKLRIRGRFASGCANCRRPATATVLEHPFYRLRLAPFSSPATCYPSARRPHVFLRYARDSRESNSRACAHPWSAAPSMYNGGEKIAKRVGPYPTLVVYATSRETVPCTCWSSRHTGVACLRYLGFTPRDTSPWTKHTQCCEMQKRSATEC